MPKNADLNAATEPGQWVEHYAEELFQFALKRVDTNETAEDLVQETFLAAIKSIEGFRQASSERTWLFSILKNKIIDFYRKKAGNNEKTGIDPLPYQGEESYYFEEDGGHWKNSRGPSNWDIDYDQPSERKEFYIVLINCLHKLPEKYRQVFVMKNLDDIGSDDICKELKITSSNYWVIMHRAKLQLRECLEKNWFKS